MSNFNNKAISALKLVSLCFFIYFSVSYLLAIIKIPFEEIHSQSGWQSGDWLINYSGGFIRRGLPGEILILINDLSGYELVSLVAILKVTLFLIFIFSLVVLAINVRIDRAGILILFSPWALMFYLNDPEVVGRKELVFLSIFTLYMILSLRFKNLSPTIWSRWKLWFSLLIFPVLVLVHEGLFFFIPYFLFFIILDREKMKVSDWFEFFIPFTFASLVFLMCYLYRGTEEQILLICNSVIQRGTDSQLCSGAIEHLIGYSYNINTNYLRIYGVSILLAFFTIFLYAIGYGKFIQFLILSIVFFALTLPLYVVAFDWGRWINVSTFLTFIILLSQKNKDYVALRYKFGAFYHLILLALLFNIIAWSIVHCCVQEETSIVIINSASFWVNLLGFTSFK